MPSTNKLSPIPQSAEEAGVGNMLSLDANARCSIWWRPDQGLGPIFWLDMMGAPLADRRGHDLIDEASATRSDLDKAVALAAPGAPRSAATACSRRIPRSRTGGKGAQHPAQAVRQPRHAVP